MRVILLADLWHLRVSVHIYDCCTIIYKVFMHASIMDFMWCDWSDKDIAMNSESVTLHFIGDYLLSAL